MPHPSIPLMILAFLLLLGPLVVLHELGHYLIGQLFGVKADAFSVGFGREIAGFNDRRGTRWKLSLLPLGGYVQFAGDMNPASAADRAAAELTPQERAHCFQFKPLWQRALIVLAGPATNLLVAVAIFAAFNMLYGQIVASPQIGGFAPHSAAQAAGLRVGDRITAIDGARINSFEQIREKVVPYPGETLKVEAQRGAQRIAVGVLIATHVDTDEFGHQSRIGMIGIAAGKPLVQKLAPFPAVAQAFRQSLGMMGMMVTGIHQIFTGARSVHELGGVVRIAQYSGERLAMGWQQFVYFGALISINLAFINLLPIPALDGGHLAFYAAEAVRRRPLGARTQELAVRTGLALVLGLMVFVTLNDIASLHLFGS